MSLPHVYIETSVISFLTAWPSKIDSIKLIQDATHEWWDNHRHRFDLIVSNVVYTEARRGDSIAAGERLIVVDQLPQILSTAITDELAVKLLSAKALPQKAADDARHIAIAAVNGLEFLLTWNLRHLNNDEMRPFIEEVCRTNGFRAPTILTPKQMMEDYP